MRADVDPAPALPHGGAVRRLSVWLIGCSMLLIGMPTILLVDDEPAIAEAVGFALQAEGFRTRHCATGAECMCSSSTRSARWRGR